MRFRKEQPRDHVFAPEKVDLVAESADDAIELVIVQDGPWTGTDAQVASFQGKVQTYVSFALDGPMVAQFPDAAGRPWRIVVACKGGPPDVRTRSILDALAERLPQFGGSLRVR